MVGENILNATSIDLLVNQLSNMTKFIQAIGGLILLYIIFGVVNTILNRKKRNELRAINNNLIDIKNLLAGKKKKKKK